jgi:hypothetical protein
VSHDGSDIAEDAAKDFVERVDELDEKIDQLDPNAVFTLADGRQMTGAELQELWRGMSFRFTSDGPFATDPSRGGANDNGQVEMDSTRYFGWLRDFGDDMGAYWFALHEFGHISDANNYADDMFWQGHINSGLRPENYNTSSPYFQNNEVFANLQAASIATALGLTPPIAPYTGYTYYDTSI